MRQKRTECQTSRKARGRRELDCKTHPSSRDESWP